MGSDSYSVDGLLLNDMLGVHVIASDIRLEVLSWRNGDSYAPRVRVCAPTREALLAFVRRHWGDDDTTWWNAFVVARVNYRPGRDG